jgi:hypothetical protein
MAELSKSQADRLERLMNKETNPQRKEMWEDMWTRAVMHSAAFSANAMRTNPEMQKMALAKGINLDLMVEPILRQGQTGGRRRKTRRTRKVKRGGFVPEGGKAFITHAPFPPPDNSFSAFVGTPENSDNSFLLHPSGKKGGKRRRSVKRK